MADREYLIHGNAGIIDDHETLHALGIGKGATPEQALQAFLDAQGDDAAPYSTYIVATSSAVVELAAEPRKGYRVKRV